MGWRVSSPSTTPLHASRPHAAPPAPTTGPVPGALSCAPRARLEAHRRAPTMIAARPAHRPGPRSQLMNCGRPPHQPQSQRELPTPAPASSAPAQPFPWRRGLGLEGNHPGPAEPHSPKAQCSECVAPRIKSAGPAPANPLPVRNPRVPRPTDKGTNPVLSRNPWVPTWACPPSTRPSPKG